MQLKNHEKKVKNIRTTRRKMKVVGTEQYIKADTGEIKEMQVISIEERDCNFHKLWLGHIINSLELIGNQKTRLCFWIIEHLNRDNTLNYTYEQIADESGIGYRTVFDTMKALIESNFLKRRNQGCYVVNPDVIFKGGKTDRMNVLIQYHEAEEVKSLKDKITVVK